MERLTAPHKLYEQGTKLCEERGHSPTPLCAKEMTMHREGGSRILRAQREGLALRVKGFVHGGGAQVMLTPTRVAIV